MAIEFFEGKSDRSDGFFDDPSNKAGRRPNEQDDDEFELTDEEREAAREWLKSNTPEEYAVVLNPVNMLLAGNAIETIKRVFTECYEEDGPDTMPEFSLKWDRLMGMILGFRIDVPWEFVIPADTVKDICKATKELDMVFGVYPHASDNGFVVEFSFYNLKKFYHGDGE